MEGQISILKNLQNVINKAFTNFKKSPKERITLEYIETRQELLEQDWLKFQNTKTNLYGNFKLESMEQKIEDIYDSTEDTYISCKSLMKSTLNKIRAAQETAQHTTGATASSSLSKSNCFVKLPKISIPAFSGNYAEWATFRDLLTSLVHKNDSLDNVQRLHYLKSHLSGEAEQLIRHTPITNANYNQCWDLLEKRYSNKKYLSNCVLKRLFGQKRISVESGSALKELLDTTCDCLNALTNLGINVTTWDVIIIHIVSFKLDIETRKQWELNVSTNDSNNDLPTFSQFKTFLENRFRALECLEPKRLPVNQNNNKVHLHNPRAMLATSSSSSNYIRCEYCSESHKLCFCKAFSKLPIETRREFVSKNKICFNCLGGNHTSYDCKKPTKCKICQKRHHSLLHLNQDSEKKVQSTTTKTAIDSTSSLTNANPIVSCFVTGTSPKPRQVLLATALVKAESRTGNYLTVRALLDQGSQACFITEDAVQFLNLKKVPVRGLVSGLGENSSTMAKHMVHLALRSRTSPDFKLKVHAYVLSKITSYLPERSFNPTLDWLSMNTLHLADPYFNSPNKIDILLGADAYSCIIQEGILKSPSGFLIAQNTVLGWVLSGVVTAEGNVVTNRVLHVQVDQDEALKRFWEIEEQKFSKKILTPEEKTCEELYSATTKRDSKGRYIVRLPFRDEDPPCKFGRSRAIAEKRFKALERKLENDIDLKESYTQVVEEYLQLGHMKRVRKDDQNKEIAVYLPHHAVIREEKTTSKVRIVFNASEKNSNGVSLNDTLMVGPTLQSDLRHTVLRWRLHSIALVADIIKMYRQVRVAEEDSMFQRILWRRNPKEELDDYELVTVTFGTASAPYQAVRTLHQVAYDEGLAYPLAKDKVLNNFYMDDLMTGCDNVQEGVEIYNQINSLLEKGGFMLQKWNSNNREIMEIIDGKKETKLEVQPEQKRTINNHDNRGKYKKDNFQGTRDTNLEFKLDNTIKILGLTWNRNDDSFQYTVNLPPPSAVPVTKRTIISDIAKLFDPLGWLAPTVVLAKTFIQKLWLTGVSWDESLNDKLVQEWGNYRKELSLLTNVGIPRWVRTKSNDHLELHGFSDASKIAYSAVIYLRVVNEAGQVFVSLLVAKTRVAPVKQISIPRLELCGAVLLSNLLTETAEVLNISSNNITAWTDSTVVLSWLNSHPSRWKTFVANRTSEILTTMKASQWFHVKTKDNPADCASRGILPSSLLDNKLWFSGPSFLTMRDIQYKKQYDLDIDLEESVKAHVTQVSECARIFERFSSLQKLIKVIAYCRRFLKKIQGNTSYLQKRELESSLQCCIRQSQREAFESEYLNLKEKGSLSIKSSKLQPLCPYLDDNDIIRLRGRLEKSTLDDQTKHPIVLSPSSHLTKLIVADAHLKTLHGGPQLVINYLRSAYWILNVKNLVKYHVYNCVACIKNKACLKTQLMGSLPTVRCTPARPFLHSGVDYAGPIHIRTSKGRGYRSYKGYICLFVCMSTRALHLELVSDMSTQAFLAAFRRFVSRRGQCSKIWSDNGTTFIGASKELKQLESNLSSIAEHLETHGTEWHFIPPHSPNFGGLWEAGVKSVKFHLRRVIGEATLTYEEMSTLLTQIEACLNSRPISVVNCSDPGESLPLTPGHFLIGEPIINVPDDNFENSNISCLSRWQALQKMLQSFWKRWSQEYLSNLMHRYKWSYKIPEPQIGDVVLIKEDNLPPSRWLLGRVMQKHPGADNITRVVTLRTKSSIIKRPTSKLCILPISA